MNNVKDLKERYTAVYPGFGSYVECMSRCLLSGLATGAITFSGTWILQYLFRHRIPYDQKYYTLLSATIGTIVGYKTTSDRSKSCQAAWMATEDKHTYLNPIQPTPIQENKTANIPKLN